MNYDGDDERVSLSSCTSCPDELHASQTHSGRMTAVRCWGTRGLRGRAGEWNTSLTEGGQWPWIWLVWSK